MRSKYDIEWDLIEVANSLVDLAMCGISRKNAVKMNALIEELQDVIEEGTETPLKIITLDGELVG